VKLGSLPIGFGGRAALGWAKRLSGADWAETSTALTSRNADHLFAVLGELKGGAMKLGQALAVYEPLIPAEMAGPYHQALIKLQAGAPTMPISDVHRLLAEQLGRRWSQRFAEFDADNAHAASIGQVHRAIWHDGREVAVKIQYPGAGQALLSDLRTLRRLAGLLQRIIPGADVRALVAELTARMAEELDYSAEANNQRAFAAAFADDPHVRVPSVVASAPKIIVTEWMGGVPLSELVHRPAANGQEVALRDYIGKCTLELHCSSPARVGLLHCDPHHGNFRLLPDGRIGMLDFGAVSAMPDGIPLPLGRLLRLAADDDSDGFLQEARAAGFVGRADRVGAQDALGFLGGFVTALRQERFHFNRAFMQAEGARLLDVHGDFKTAQALNLPAQYLMILRTWAGWTSILSQIDCTVNTRDILRTWVPGFNL
jgi:predicted unusual protein kinase regulating ubiquinone biosynthesis (AarF/ABC1/UbiB family)